MLSIDDIDGWESGGALAGRDISEIVGKNKETGAIMYIKISGGKYQIAIGLSNSISERVLIGKPFKDKTDAKLNALQIMNEYEILDVDKKPARILDKTGERVSPRALI